MMKCIGMFFFLIGLLACASSEKTDYDSALSKRKPVSALQRNKASRGIAGVKQSLSLKDDHVQFVVKQMKLIIKNYKKMKTRLKTIEDRLNLLLAKNLLRQNSKRQNSKAQNSQGPPSPELERQSQAGTAGLQNSAGPASSIDKESSNDLPPSVKPSSAGEESATEPGIEKPSSLIQKKMSDEENIFQDGEGEEWGEEPLLKMPDPKSSDTQDEGRSKEALPKAPSPSSTAPSNHLLDLKRAKKLFKSRSYENAISHFQRYRDKNPEGRHYPEATFYIGQSFKQLEMPLEAEVFFKEVVQSHPDSLWALRAGKLLDDKE